MARPDVRTVGIVEDDPIMGESLVQNLALEGLGAVWWQSGREAIAGARGSSRPDAIVCDIRLPDMSGEDVFHEIGRSSGAPPFLFMTAYADLDQAVRLMRAGAGDYVTKPFRMAEFHERLAALLPAPPAHPDAVLGVSPEMREIEVFLQRIAAQSGPVLILGETGVGKEVCARYLHAISRPKTPFVAVNCAAIPAELLESEIFGHERGAFTGATSRHLGYAERARDGTLFLDEIGDMPKPLQAKLLRLIEERSFSRIGGESAIPFAARVVTATHADLYGDTAGERFRRDLLYRLDMFTIEVPPLRQRRDDIAWLAARFLASAREDGRTGVRGIGPAGLEALRLNEWSGNVRELRNRVERAVALTANEWLTPADLFPPRRPGEAATVSMAPRAGSLADVREAAEKQAIEDALAATGGQIQETARLLGVSRTTLWEKMKRLGVRS